MRERTTTVRASCQACFILMTAGLAGCALMGPAPRTASSHPISMEAGVIERLRTVTLSADGVRLGHRQGSEGAGLYDGPSEADEVQGMISAVRAAYSGAAILSDGRPSGSIIGTAYMVRLACGGLVYAFEDGPQVFRVGDAVLADHSLSPQLFRR
jgi:hypothetical protein